MNVIKKINVLLVVFTMMISMLNITTVSVEASSNTGDFIVSGGVLDTDYSYVDNTLTILSSAELTISGSTTTDMIVVSSEVEANLILSKLSINLSSYTSGVYCPINLQNAGVSTITLVGTTTLNAGWQSPGIRVPSYNLLTIQGDGTLYAYGATYWPGIGTSDGNGNILITSGTIYAYGGDDGGAGIGGSNSSGAGTIEITGGTVYAEGGTMGAGIGGGVRGSGGTITISGGTITAIAGSGGTGTSTGIGGGASSSSTGTFSTGENGTAVITTSSIADKSNIDEWSCLTSIGTSYTVYGDITLTEDLTITSGQSLTIYDGATLTVNEDVTVTINNGATVDAYGTIVNKGTFENTGDMNIYNTIQGNEITGTGNITKEISIEISFEEEGTVMESLLYGNTYTFMSVFSFSNPVSSNGIEISGTVNMYINENLITSEDLTNNTFVFDTTTNSEEWKLGSNTVKVTYESDNGYADNEETMIIYVRDTRTIDAPTVSEIYAVSVTLNSVSPSEGSDTVYYGCSQTNDIETVSNWQSSTTFSSLEPGTTYYFFTKVNISDEYLATNSVATEITTMEAYTEIIGSLDLTNGLIEISSSDKEGFIYINQGNDVYEISSDTEIIITSTGTTNNRITVDGAEVNITLDNLSIKYYSFGNGAIELSNNASLTLTLVNDNEITFTRECYAAAINVEEGSSLIIEGEGSLVIGEESNQFMIGIGYYKFGSFSNMMGDITINNGNITIYAYQYSIGIDSDEDDSVVTINGGTITAEKPIYANEVTIGNAIISKDDGNVMVYLDEDNVIISEETTITIDGVSLEFPSGVTLLEDGTIKLTGEQTLVTTVGGESITVSSTDIEGSTTITLEDGQLVLTEGTTIAYEDKESFDVTDEGMSVIPDANFIVTFDTMTGTVVAITVANGKYISEPTDPVYEGYVFNGWYKDIEFTTLWDFNLDTVTKDITLYANWVELSEYETIEGNNQVITYGENETITFTIDADANEFVGLYLNDSLVDESMYSVVSGSTIITLNKEYVETLTANEYTFLIEYTYGYAYVTLSVVEADEDTDLDDKDDTELEDDTVLDDKDDTEEVTPDTGDTTNATMLMLAMLLSLVAGLFVYRKNKKK